MYYTIDNSSIRGIAVQLEDNNSLKSGEDNSVDIASITKDTVFDFVSGSKVLSDANKADCNKVMPSSFSFWNNC